MLTLDWRLMRLLPPLLLGGCGIAPTAVGFRGTAVTDGPDFGIHEVKVDGSSRYDGRCEAANDGARVFHFCFHHGRSACDQTAAIKIDPAGSADVDLPWSHRFLAAGQCHVHDVSRPVTFTGDGMRALTGTAHLVCDASTRTEAVDHLEVDVEYRGCTGEWNPE